MTAPATKPVLNDVMPIVRSLFDWHAAGCCWHVVLDDGNLSDYFVDQCCKGVDPRHEYCVALARVLPLMSKTQRKLLYLRHHHER